MESQAITCRQCRKEIKTKAHKCIPCEKIFHPSCVKLDKVQNREKELISCKGAEAASGSGKEAKAAKCRTVEL